MRILAATALLTLAAGTAWARPVIEDFEHGNEGLWNQQTAGDNMTLNAASAFAGNFGAEFSTGASGFRTRFDLATAPGAQYTAMIRSRGDLPNGRLYLGVGASAAGTWSAVYAPNSSQIILQNNTGFGFITAASAPFTPTPNTWYVLMLDWAGNGDMTVRIFDQSMTTVLAATPTNATGFIAPGGVAIRGFSTIANNFLDMDNINVIPAPAGVLAIGGFGLLATRRRRG